MRRETVFSHGTGDCRAVGEGVAQTASGGAEHVRVYASHFVPRLTSHQRMYLGGYCCPEGYLVGDFRRSRMNRPKESAPAGADGAQVAGGLA